MKIILEKFKMYGFKKSFLYLISELFHKSWKEFFKKSYSQKGEDLIIDKLLGRIKNGFYVDIGANNPDRFSNTKRFYNRGWRGINIEPDIENFKKILSKRKNDINLNIGIGNMEEKLIFYKFIPDTLSTFSKRDADNYMNQGYKLINTEEILVRRLSEVLKEYVFNKKIDFMSIDTEGFDMHVLRSNDWNKFRPTLICIESAVHTMNGENDKKVDNHEFFLMELGYKKVYDNKLNSIYKRND